MQPLSYDDRGYFTVNVSVTAAPVENVDVFYDQLDPYGTWYDDDPTYGWVFTPSSSSYVPYSNGHWNNGVSMPSLVHASANVSGISAVFAKSRSAAISICGCAASAHRKGN